MKEILRLCSFPKTWCLLLLYLSLLSYFCSAGAGQALGGSRIKCPYQSEQNSHKVVCSFLTSFYSLSLTLLFEQPYPALTSCTWYAEDACCDHRDTNDIIRWIYDTRKTFRGSEECFSLVHLLRCGLACSPKQAEFVEYKKHATLDEEAAPRSIGIDATQMKATSTIKRGNLYVFRICSGLCERIYEACKSTTMATSLGSWHSPEPNSSSFCQSLAPPGVMIVIVNDTTYTRCISSSELSRLATCD